MRYLASVVTLIIVLGSGYFFIFDARSAQIVQRYRPALPKKKKVEEQAVLKAIPGDKSRQRVEISADAAKRLAITTAEVRERATPRIRRMTGRIDLSAGTPHIVVQLAGTSDRPTPGSVAKVNHIENVGTEGSAPLLEVTKSPDGQTSVARFALDPSATTFMADQRVMVDVDIGGTTPRTAVPRGSIVYDPKGNSWVFVAVAPLAFVRAPVRVAYIEGDWAILADGPPIGARVAATGVTEIFGTEGKIGPVGVAASF